MYIFPLLNDLSSAGDLCCFLHPLHKSIRCYGEVVEVLEGSIRVKMVKREQKGNKDVFFGLTSDVRDVPLDLVLYSDGNAEKMDLSFRKTHFGAQRYASNDMARKSSFQLVETTDGCRDYISVSGILNYLVKPTFIRSVNPLSIPQWPLRCSQEGASTNPKEEVDDESDLEEETSCVFDQSHWNVRKQPGVSLSSFLMIISEQYHCKEHDKWVDAADPNFVHREGCQSSHQLRKCGTYFFDGSAVEFIWNSMFKPDSFVLCRPPQRLLFS